MFEDRKGMARLKRIVELVFLSVASIVLLAQVISIYLGWRHGKNVDREIREGARVAVVKTVTRFPPGFLVEYENSGRLPISKTQFRLAIELGTAVVARIDRDYGEIKPGKTERVLLQTVAASPPPQVEPGTRLSYRLLVFPNNKKPLPEITGNITIE